MLNSYRINQWQLPVVVAGLTRLYLIVGVTVCALLILVCSGNLQASDKPAPEAGQLFAQQRQSILFQVEQDALTVVRRVAPQAGATPRAASADDVEIMPAAAVDAAATFNTPTGRSSAVSSAVISSEQPYVVWLDSNGEVLAINRFEDPRLLRAPNQNGLPHAALPGRSDGLFLLRGPGAATALHLHLPDRLVLWSRMVAGSKDNAQTLVERRGDAAYFSQRAWRINLR